MTVSGQTTETRRTAGELLRFLERMMDAIVRVDLGDPAVAQLTLLELRILMVLGAARRPSCRYQPRCSARQGERRAASC
jgi:hypothetical protein